MALPLATPYSGDSSGLNLGGVAGAGLDIWSLLTGQSGKNANAAIKLADPIAPAQGQALGQLQQFLTDPSSVLKDPAFLAAENLGAENISRQAGAAGMASSGNRLADLFKFGQTAGLGYENQRFNQLMQVLQGSPAAAGILTAGQDAKTGQLGDLFQQLFGSSGGAAGGLLGGLIKGILGGGGGGGGGSIPGMGDLGVGGGSTGFDIFGNDTLSGGYGPGYGDNPMNDILSSMGGDSGGAFDFGSFDWSAFGG